MHGDEIGDGKHFVHGIEQRDAELACASRRAIRVEAHNAHAERMGALGNETANASKTENGERLFIELVAHEAIAAEFARMRRGIGGGNFASRRKHERHSVLGRRNDIARRNVAYGNAMLACGINIDVVARHAGAADNLAIRRGLNHLARDLGGGANDKGIVGADALEQLARGQAEALIDLVALPLQDVDALVDDFIGHQNLHCDSPFTAITPALRGCAFRYKRFVDYTHASFRIAKPSASEHRASRGRQIDDS